MNSRAAEATEEDSSQKTKKQTEEEEESLAAGVTIATPKSAVESPWTRAPPSPELYGQRGANFPS